LNSQLQQIASEIVDMKKELAALEAEEVTKDEAKERRSAVLRETRKIVDLIADRKTTIRRLQYQIDNNGMHAPTMYAEKDYDRNAYVSGESLADIEQMIAGFQATVNEKKLELAELDNQVAMKEKELAGTHCTNMPYSAAEWNALAQKITPHASGAFDPDRPLMSGPKHTITLHADGFTEGGAFTHYLNTTPQQGELLNSLASGERPAQYTGGRCPHSVLLYVKDGSGASNSTEMCDVLNADLEEIQASRKPKSQEKEELREVQMILPSRMMRMLGVANGRETYASRATVGWADGKLRLTEE